MAVHAVDMALVFNELLDTFRQNFRYFLIECRARDTAKPGRLARLRYLHRQLLKPPDVPRTPSADLTLRLYRMYGHPYSHVVSGIEGHVVCWVIGVAVRLSTIIPGTFRLVCFLGGLLITLSILLAAELITAIIILITWLLLEFLRATSDHVTWTFDVIDEWRAAYQEVYPPPHDLWTSLIAGLKLAAACSLVVGLVWVVEAMARGVGRRVRGLFRRSIPDFQVCRVCLDEKRTQYFQPCQHLSCCKPCGLRLYQCPVCKLAIKAETRVQPLIGSRCVVCEAAEVSRLLVPCGHVVCCAPCASQLDDCPLCWEEVTDDKQVYLP